MSVQKSELIAEFPAKLQFLWTPARYKVAYGGRGSGKSWGIARALLLMGVERPLRILCAREIQKSIADSVHKLIADQIDALNLDAYYTVQETKIYGPNGTEFLFGGLKHNVNSIKSTEGIDIAWIEEAQTVSKSSWDVLIPTIRKEGSEIWVSFNPDLEVDETYQRFVVNPSPGTVAVKVNYLDNPWFPDVLRVEAEHLKATNPDSYSHIWEGNCISALDGAVYANEIRLATSEDRISKVPYDASKPVSTYWDLGYGDYTSIWFIQQVGFEFRVLDFEEGSQQALPYYLKKLQERPYVYGTHYLPWDGAPKQLGTGKSILDLIRAAGHKAEVVAKLSVADGINAARTVFGRCYFDSSKCADGLHALRHYRYGKVEKLDTTTREPLHDWSSHAADAFRTFGVGIQEPKSKKPAAKEQKPFYGAGGWMA